jgi:hypothetical protein
MLLGSICLVPSRDRIDRLLNGIIRHQRFIMHSVQGSELGHSHFSM